VAVHLGNPQDANSGLGLMLAFPGRGLHLRGDWCIAMKTILISLVLLVAGTVSAGPLLEKPGLVSTAWLARHLDNPEVRVIDARASLASYVQGHLPRAVYLNTETFRFSEGGVPARLFPPELLAEMLGRMGIGNGHTVIIYSSHEESFSHAAYVAYLLEWLGHLAIGVVDGGFEKWQREERPVTKEFPAYERVEFRANLDNAVFKNAGHVQRAIHNESAVILDARSPAIFAAGHLPTARNFFLRETLAENDTWTWKSPEYLRELAAAAGADGSQPIITYCTSGRESAQIWFTLRHVAGFEQVSSYHGSWIDWTVRRLPVQEQ
jgi:thiosulfate/3-mercaptopyruvate sulfurtransferase